MLGAIRDRVLVEGPNRISYRRSVAFAVATWLVYLGKIDTGTWGMVAAVFIGAEVAGRYVARNNEGA